MEKGQRRECVILGAPSLSISSAARAGRASDPPMINSLALDFLARLHLNISIPQEI